MKFKVKQVSHYTHLIPTEEDKEPALQANTLRKALKKQFFFFQEKYICNTLKSNNCPCLALFWLDFELFFFCMLQAFPVCNLSEDHYFIEPKDLVNAQTKLGVDCKAAMLCGTTIFFSIIATIFCQFLGMSIYCVVGWYEQ